MEQRLRFSRTVAVSFSLLLFVSLFGWIITVLVIHLSEELFHFSQSLPGYLHQFTEFIYNALPKDQMNSLYERFQIWYGTLQPDTQAEIDHKLRDWLSTISQLGVSFIQTLLNGIIRFITALPSTLTILVISIIAAFLFSKDYEKILQWFKSRMPRKMKNSTNRVLTDLRTALFGFLKAQMILILITMTLVCTGLMLLGIENAITIGILAGFFDLLPYLGTGTIFIPWILYLYFSHQYNLVIGLSILYGTVVLFRQVLEPRVLAKNVGIHPILALVALFVGLQLMGFLGMMLGPFAVILLQSLYRARVFHEIWEYIKISPTK